MENKHNCAPKIWKKFSKEQKEFFNEFRDNIGDKNNFISIYCHPKFPEITDEMYDVLIHNLACEAAWAYDRVGID